MLADRDLETHKFALVTRQEAIARDAKRYFTAIACKNGHIAERITKSFECVECLKNRTYEFGRRYRQTEKRRLKQREYAKRAYRKNPSRWTIDQSIRRARRRKATPPWVTSKDFRPIFNRAAELTATTGIQHHVDHIMPLAGKLSCGLHVPWNLQILTGEANRRKFTKETGKLL